MTGLTPHQRIIRERFGGISRLADLLGTYRGSAFPKSTVQGWDESGIIPAKHHPDVLEVGQKLEAPLREWEFFRISQINSNDPSVVHYR